MPLPDKVTINGYVFNALGLPSESGITARISLLQVSPQNSMILVNEPDIVSVGAGGFVTFDLYPTQEYRQLYRLELIGSDDNILASTDFTVPESDVPLELGTLIRTGNVNPNALDTSIRRLAEYIRSRPDLLEIFSGGYTPRGNYSASATYSYLDTVAYDGTSYVCIRRIPITGIQPGTDTSAWQIVAQRGATGVGAGQGVNTAYNETVWLADTTAPPTRSAVAAQIEVLRDLADSKVSANNPTLTGLVTVPTNNTIGNITASTQFVDTNYAGLNSPAFTGTPTTPTSPRNSNSTTVASTAFAQSLIVSPTETFTTVTANIQSVSEGALTPIVMTVTGSSLGTSGITTPSNNRIQFPSTTNGGLYIIEVEQLITIQDVTAISNLKRFMLDISFDSTLASWSNWVREYVDTTSSSTAGVLRRNSFLVPSTSTNGASLSIRSALGWIISNSKQARVDLFFKIYKILNRNL